MYISNHFSKGLYQFTVWYVKLDFTVSLPLHPLSPPCQNWDCRKSNFYQNPLLQITKLRLRVVLDMSKLLVSGTSGTRNEPPGSHSVKP